MNNENERLKWLEKLKILIQPYSDTLSVQTYNSVRCNVCRTTFRCSYRQHLEQHVKSQKHKSNISLGPRVSGSSQCDQKSFIVDLVEALISANIPFRKVNSPVLKRFLEKHCSRKIPDESTLRKYYLAPVYEKVMTTIHKSLEDKYLWISVDAITDSFGQYVANVMVGPLNHSTPIKPFLVASKVLEKLNGETISLLVKSTLASTASNNSKVLLLVTDSAEYMLKAGQILQASFPHLIHVTCLADALHRICEFIREEFPVVDEFISDMEKHFLKAPSLIRVYSEQSSNLKLLPQPVLTRGTWISAAVFYADNLQSIRQVIESLEDSVKSVSKCKAALQSAQLSLALNLIKEHFGKIPSVIEKLEGHNMPLSESMDHFDGVISRLRTIQGEFGNRLNEYIEKILMENPGYSKLQEIKQKIVNSDKENLEEEGTLDKYYCFAPVTSGDVQQTFSKYQDILTNKRNNFGEVNLEQVLVIYCNSHRDL